MANCDHCEMSRRKMRRSLTMRRRSGRPRAVPARERNSSNQLIRRFRRVGISLTSWLAPRR